MTDRPILFSGAMIRALLAGSKTQTRRVIPRAPMEADYEAHRGEDGVWRFLAEGPDVYGRERAQLSYDVGDRLWVRETVACGACATSRPAHWALSFWRREQGTPANPNGLWYRADDLAPGRLITERGRWVPGIHMPRWASRLTLTVTNVRVQRLQVIGGWDAIAEGIERDPETGAWWGAEGQGVGGATRLYEHAAHAYRDLWDHLNEARGYGWEANPWVVALSFDVQCANIDVPRLWAAA